MSQSDTARSLYGGNPLKRAQRPIVVSNSRHAFAFRSFVPAPDLTYWELRDRFMSSEALGKDLGDYPAFVDKATGVPLALDKYGNLVPAGAQLLLASIATAGYKDATLKTLETLKKALQYGPLSLPTKNIGGCVVSCRPEGAVSMLLHALDPVKNPETITPVAQFNSLIEENSCVAAIGTSGCGKTRTMLEILSRRFGFYLTAINQEIGSGDFAGAMKATEDVLDNDHIGNLNKAHKNVAGVILGRLQIFNAYIDMRKEAATPYEFLLLQIFPEAFCGNDIFASLTSASLELTESELAEEIASEEQVLLQNFQKLQVRKAKVVYVLDEAQVCIVRMRGKFASRSPEARRRRPFIAPAFGEITKRAQTCLCVSGTGLALNDIDNLGASSIAKFTTGGTMASFYDFGAIDTLAALQTYLQQFFPIPKTIVARAYREIRGRYRPIASFVELALRARESHHEYKFAQTLDTLVVDCTTEQRNGRGATSFYNQLLKLETNERTSMYRKRFVFETIRLALYQAVYAGPLIRFLDTDEHALIEYGFCRLTTDQTCDPKKVIGVFDEPLAIKAACNYFIDHTRGVSEVMNQAIRAFRGNMAVAGFGFERLIMTDLDALFAGNTVLGAHELFKSLASQLPSSWSNFPATLQDLRPPNVLERTRRASQNYKLADWLCDQHRIPFFYPEETAGPDVVGAFTLGFTTQVVYFFAQSKLRADNFGWSEAVNTTNPESFFASKGGPDLASRQAILDILQQQSQKNASRDQPSYTRNPVLRILVVYPAKRPHGVDSRVIASTRSTRSSTRTPPDVLLIVDESNARSLLSAVHLDIVHSVRNVQESVAEDKKLLAENNES